MGFVQQARLPRRLYDTEKVSRMITVVIDLHTFSRTLRFPLLFLHYFSSTAAARVSARSHSNPSRFAAKIFRRPTRCRYTPYPWYTPQRQMPPSPTTIIRLGMLSSDRWCKWATKPCHSKITRDPRNQRRVPAQQLPISPPNRTRTCTWIR